MTMIFNQFNYNPKIIQSILRLNIEYRVHVLPVHVVYVKHGHYIVTSVRQGKLEPF